MSAHQTSHITLQNQIQSPLLRLPAELRHQIYDHSVIHKSISVLKAGKRFLFLDSTGKVIRLLILPLICRQIYSETINMQASIHTLLGQLTDVYSLMKSRTTLNATLETISLEVSTSIFTAMDGPDRSLYNLLDIVRGLEDLTKLEIWCSSRLDTGFDPREIRDELAWLFELDRPNMGFVVIVGSGDDIDRSDIDQLLHDRSSRSSSPPPQRKSDMEP